MRVMARTLEQQWEAGLQEIDRLEAEFAAFWQQKPLTLFPINALRKRQTLLSADLPPPAAIPSYGVSPATAAGPASLPPARCGWSRSLCWSAWASPAG